MRSLLFLLLIGALAAGVLIWISGDHGNERDEGLAFPLEDGVVGGPSADDTEDPDGTEDAPAVVASPDGLPRILPPEAAIEDVRDALAITTRAERVEALRSAYASLGRIAQQARILAGLQRYVLQVADPRVRGVTYAALGANTSGTSQAWLAGRLKEGPTTLDRLGALLGLAYNAKADETSANALGALPHRRGSLPKRVDVREGLAVLLAALEAGDTAADSTAEDATVNEVRHDALSILAASLKAHPAWFAKERPAILRLQRKAGD